jgi:glutamate-5-semialdehyde dehydrogenase
MTNDLIHNLSTVNNSVNRAYQSSLRLVGSSGIDRSRAVQLMAKLLAERVNDLLEANTLDLEISREMAVPNLILDWLKLTPERIKSAVEILQRLGELSDPIRRVMSANYQLEQSQTYCQLMPLGVITLIYEALPELAAIAAGLCIKTGNSLILRCGSESTNSNTVIVDILQTALTEANLSPDCLQLLLPEQGASIKDLVTQDRYINLIIPYGRPSLIKQVTQLATAPVLKVAMGNCYLYWSLGGNLDMVKTMIYESHQSQPDPVNAIEKVLINRQQKHSSVVMLWNSLKEKGFELRGDEDLVNEFPQYLKYAVETEWNQPYLGKIIAFKIVENMPEAIATIKQYSSGHADCIVTDSYQESRQFALGIDSATVYINSSPKFVRNPHRGEAILLGMSNQKGQRRGAISMESLTTLKHIVQGNN